MSRKQYYLVIGLLVAILVCLAVNGKYTAKAASQRTSASILAEIKSTVEPGGAINTQNSAASKALINGILWCVNQDTMAAASHAPTVDQCVGVPLPPQRG